MWIKKIKINNFRNYKNQEIDLGKNVNIFYGDNAQGKTNIIESIFVCSLGKSFRTNKDKELYGENRLADFLNEHQDDDARTTCELVKENVDEFYKGVAQFDDITEMSLIYKQYMIEEQKG